jgi:hypothetical protein
MRGEMQVVLTTMMTAKMMVVKMLMGSKAVETPIS